ncbi:MAG: hypothetical protein ACFNVQ_03145 [Campylobacter sp.]
MAVAVIEFLRFVNRAVKFQALALCFLKPDAHRKDAVAKQSARKRVKFTGVADE